MKAHMISLALVAALIAVMLPLSVFATPPSSGTHKVLVENTDRATLADLAQGGRHQARGLWQFLVVARARCARWCVRGACLSHDAEQFR